MKRVHKFLATTLFSIACFNSLLSQMPQKAYALTYGQLEYEIVTSKNDVNVRYIVITGCDKSATEITIPEEIDGLPVEEIFGNESKGAFNGCSKLRSLTISDSLRKIGESDNFHFAFKECINLEEINVIPSSGNRQESYDFRFASQDGVLLSLYQGDESMHYSSIVFYPMGKKEKHYSTPKDIPVVFYNAFTGNPYLESITMSADLSLIFSPIILNCINVKSVNILNPSLELYGYIIDDPNSYSGVIRGHAESDLKEYVESFGYNYEAIEKGDINGDGTVGADDAQLALNAYTQCIADIEMDLNKAQVSTADVDENGELSVEDAQLILSYYTVKTVANKEIKWDDLIKNNS